ncbi:MAG TPA: ABC transporter substrate-binding protein [Acetobacteraceae bacterium]|nr:ABC transporter substrate-binding protein [Acetobacteraceae bacterium]
MTTRVTAGRGRRSIIRAGAALGAVGLGLPSIIRARGETPVRIGFVNSLSGPLSALAHSEVQGAQYGVAEINRNGGVLGRSVQLLVEDSGNDIRTGIEKALTLINRDKIDALLGDANPAIAEALAQVAIEHKLYQLVPGAHADRITGSACKWNVFRICGSIRMDANALSGKLIGRFGKQWYFITPDHDYGHTLQDAFVRSLEKAGGEYQASVLPANTTDFSASLQKARDYRADVLLNNMGGAAQVDCMRQFVQLGMDQEMTLGGALFELESVLSVPAAAQIGWWDMEWWWDQPGVPHVAEFVAGIRTMFSVPAATARHWFGYVAVGTLRLAASDARSLEAVSLAKATAGMILPPEIALQPGKVTYRQGDHQLTAGIFVGQMHPPQGDPANVFTVADIVSGEQAAGAVGDSGCKIAWPKT